MSQIIECPQCHQGNELGRMFCNRCGTKLDMAPMTAAKARALDWGTLLGHAGRVGGFLVLLILVLLLIWPVAKTGKCGDESDLNALLGQRAALRQGAQQNKELKLEVTETALNAYLTASLKQARSNEAAEAAWMMNLAELNVGVKVDKVTVTALAHWGPLSITWQISGTPKLADKHFILDAKAGSIGHLGLPRSGAEWMAARMAVLFNRWTADRELLEQLASLTAGDGSLTLTTRSAAGNE